MKENNYCEKPSIDDAATEKQSSIEMNHDTHYPLAADSTGGGDPEWLEMYYSVSHSDNLDEIRD